LEKSSLLSFLLNTIYLPSRNHVANLPIIPKEIKDDPEQAIFGLDLRPFNRTIQNYQLLMQGQIFSGKICY
jgi:hypothetical protein